MLPRPTSTTCASRCTKASGSYRTTTSTRINVGPVEIVSACASPHGNAATSQTQPSNGGPNASGPVSARDRNPICNSEITVTARFPACVLSRKRSAPSIDAFNPIPITAAAAAKRTIASTTSSNTDPAAALFFTRASLGGASSVEPHKFNGVSPHCAGCTDDLDRHPPLVLRFARRKNHPRRITRTVGIKRNRLKTKTLLLNVRRIVRRGEPREPAPHRTHLIHLHQLQHRIQQRLHFGERMKLAGFVQRIRFPRHKHVAERHSGLLVPDSFLKR